MVDRLIAPPKPFFAVNSTLRHLHLAYNRVGVKPLARLLSSLSRHGLYALQRDYTTTEAPSYSNRSGSGGHVDATHGSGYEDEVSESQGPDKKRRGNKTNITLIAMLFGTYRSDRSDRVRRSRRNTPGTQEAPIIPAQSSSKWISRLEVLDLRCNAIEDPDPRHGVEGGTPLYAIFQKVSGHVMEGLLQCVSLLDSLPTADGTEYHAARAPLTRK